MATLVNYAIVDEETLQVVNVCLWDGVTPWNPPKGTFAVRDAKRLARKGDVYEGEEFKRPPEPPASEPAPDATPTDG